MKRNTMLALDEELKRKAKAKASLLGITLDEFFNRILEQNTNDVYLKPKEKSK